MTSLYYGEFVVPQSEFTFEDGDSELGLDQSESVYTCLVGRELYCYCHTHVALERLEQKLLKWLFSVVSQ